jgi:carbon storage regulator
MLVLSRGEGETIHIGDRIRVTIVRIGKVVRLGIEAPADVEVHRGEVYKRILAERAAEQAADSCMSQIDVIKRTAV